MIREFSFEGKTAIFTTACASMVGERILDLPLDDVLSMTYADVRAIVGVDISPRRRQASTFGLLAIRNALHKYLTDGKVDDWSDIFV